MKDLSRIYEKLSFDQKTLVAFILRMYLSFFVSCWCEGKFSCPIFFLDSTLSCLMQVCKRVTYEMSVSLVDR
ncbi:hypothetical protein Nepgr_018557 [Nepenthes gracilis]|uniref:Uncharacterized protein n=1 Tax=Nepenthes gracilis TaxID=150966 RepID=A0AAD3SVB7_NEPGR|nr:hypothetical protein Nepgr_018557 [Nepenthes gracilis]